MKPDVLLSSGLVAVPGVYTMPVLRPAGEVTPPTLTIATQPQSQIGFDGGTVTFSVAAAGTLPITFQWRKNNTAISGATSTSLVLTNVSTADNGMYTVVVTNIVGSIQSAEASFLLTPFIWTLPIV